ncbi:kinesin-like protein Klp10A isoform X3 [Atheta coriaria]|uniref:kinesin-like protein Klp10A isoform X3 n=1 Tax=Dalotia coriaria TaxID=877792 RepID=UPI0031F3F7B7
MASPLTVGCSINIKRTDGRIHSAIVAGIDLAQGTAVVEWFEQNETKGKEINLAAIESLNPELMRPEASSVAEPARPEATIIESARPEAAAAESAFNHTSSKLQRESSGSSEEESAHMAHMGRYRQDESDEDFNSNQVSPDSTTLSNPSQQSITSTNNRPTNGSIRTTRAMARATIGNPEIIPPPKENVASRLNIISSNPRRSNVVKEVEKLKKNREERRQRQAEEKAEKEAFMQMAPGNPHWELLNMIMDYRRGLDINPLCEADAVEDHLITVCVRKRPVNKKEASKKEVDVITIPSKNQLIVHEPKNKVDLTKYLENQIFRFDYAFDETCNNEIVYRYTAQPLIKTIFDGGFATCFAYGQTGSGKTHTMGGEFIGKTQDCNRGIYALAAADVFKFAKSAKYRQLNAIISASFFEIYSGKVFDLLNNKAKLRVLEDGRQQVQVVGLTEKVVVSTEEVLKLIQRGNQARTSGQTSANTNSSRSHAVFQIIVRLNNSPQKIHGKFSLIDLAGNERGADTSSADRQTRMEGAEINKSLLALKECIRALGRKGAHLPFRVSKLTQVLRDSFVGPNSRTCMIAMVSPSVASCEHTLNTLRYADRVKELGAGDLIANQGDDGFDKQEDGDLLQLHSLSENDMTPEMLNFHQVVSDLQMAEDAMLDNHKQTYETMYTNTQKMQVLLRAADDVTYDQEEYCQAWESVIESSMATLDQAREIVADYKAKMANEEQVSRKTKRK